MHWPYRPVVRFGRGGQCRARSKGASEGRKDERIVLWSCCILSAVNPESGARNLAVRLPRGIAHSQATAATTIVRVGLESPPSRSLRSHHENRPSRSLGLGHSLEAENRPCRSPKSGLDDCPDCHSEFAIRVGHAEVAMRLGDRLILIFCAPFAGLPPATSVKFFATRRVCPTRSMQRPGRRLPPPDVFSEYVLCVKAAVARNRAQVLQYPPLAPDVSPAYRRDRLAHSEQAISALAANISEDDSLRAVRRARVVQLEDTARSVCQWFQIHHYGRSVSPLPNELPPDERERIYGPTGLGS